MHYDRRAYSAPKGELRFSFDVPPGFVEDMPAPGSSDAFEGPGAERMLALSAVLEPVHVRATQRPAGAARSVEQVLREILAACGAIVDALERIEVGGGVQRHPALEACGELECITGAVRFVAIALEVQSRIIVLDVHCPRVSWSDYGTFALELARSFEVEAPCEATLPLVVGDPIAAPVPLDEGERERAALKPYQLHELELKEKRAPVLPLVREHFAAGRYDEGELALREADPSIYGAVAVAELYREHLRELVAEGSTSRGAPRVREVFTRALSSAQSAYPEPHTAIEAEEIERGCAEDLARLVQIAGGDPRETEPHS